MFHPVRTVALIGMASLLPFHGARLAAAEPLDTPVTCVAENHDFTLKDLRGRYVVIHLLGTGDPTGQRAHIREFLDGFRTLAGVHDIFIRADSAESVRSLAAEFPKHGAEFAYDAGGKLARELKIDPAAAHAIVTLDDAGNELFRQTGDAPAAAVSFKAFRERFSAAWAAPARAEYNLPKDSTLAVQGYDVVSYFTDGKPAKGDDKIAAEYRGVTYRFVTQTHREAFVANPKKYIPTYGGWCASAIGAKGEKVAIDPTNFKIKDGRLFLFYKSLFADALKDWNKHENEWEPAADANWKKIAGE